MDRALAPPGGNLAPDLGEILAEIHPDSEGFADEEAELGLDDDAVPATAAKEEASPAAATRRDREAMNLALRLHTHGGAPERGEADQAARERPRLGAYIRVVAYLAFDSPRRLIAYVRGNSAFCAVADAFEPWITVTLDTLGGAARLATTGAWAGLRDATVQPRIWACLLVRLAADASRRIVASAVGTPAFRAAAEFLPREIMELAHALAAAAYLATATARAGLRTAPARARRGARGARVLLRLVADASRRIVASAVGTPAFRAAAEFLPREIMELAHALAAAAYLATATARAGLRAAPARARRGARGARVLLRLVADASRRIVASAVGTPAFRAAAEFLPREIMELAHALAAAAYLATATARAGLRAAPARARRGARGARVLLRLVADTSRRLVAFVVGNVELAAALWAAAYLATTAARAGLVALLAQPRRWARGVLQCLVLAAAGYAVVDAFTSNAILILIVSVFGVPGLLQLGCMLAAVAVAYAARHQ